ncbi:MAG: hypothetical protein M3506_05190 [Chloroflexota bacterium]|nr:hypothetical protein [Chloroflexota bacterium]
MSNTEDTNRTTIPADEAEGAGNFAAEPGPDPTAGATPENSATQMEIGNPVPDQENTAAGEEGNRSGGEPVEETIERRANSEADAEELEEQLDETSIDQSAEV